MRRILLAAALLLATTLTFAVGVQPETAAGMKLSGGQTTLYGGVGRGGGEDRGTLITIDQAAGDGTFVGLGASDPAVGITGLAFDTSGDLFASTISSPVFGDTPPVGTLIRLNPVTGVQVAQIGSIRLADNTPVVINDLAVQPGTDILFGSALNLNTGSNNVYTIDKTTAVATFVGDTGIIGATLAFGPDGTLYQTSAEFNETGFVRGFLNTLDPDTAAVLSTSAPFTEAHIGGLAVRPTDGVIFASGGVQSDIYTLSLDGGLTFLGLTGFGGVGDIAFTPLPTDKSQCKNDGWRHFSFPYTFKNQGDCIQLVNTGK